MTLHYFRTNFNRRGPLLFLKCLLAIDLLFIGVHLYLILTDTSHMGVLMVDADKGIPEIFQYFKFLGIVVISAYLVFVRKKANYFAWGCVFFLFFLDDAFQLHEKIGKVIAYWFDFQPMMGLKPRDIGEVAYMVCAGTGILAFMALSYTKGSQKFRYTCWDIAILFCPFLFFAVGIDMVHSILEKNYRVGKLLALFEDGGEMLAVSLLTWYFCFIAVDRTDSRHYLFQYFTGTSIPPGGHIENGS